MDGVAPAAGAHEGVATTAATIIEGEVRELAKLAGIDLLSNRRQLQALVKEVAASYEERLLTSALPPINDVRAAVRSVMDALTGFGPLQRWVDDEEVEEIWIGGQGRVYLHRGGRKEQLAITMPGEAVEELVERVIVLGGQRLDMSYPVVEVTLDDGLWVQAVLPPIARHQPVVLIRRSVIVARSLGEMVEQGVLTGHAAQVLAASVAAGLTVVVSGPSRSGKTTMLNALLSEVPDGERVICCEEFFELKPDRPDVVSMQTRIADPDGEGEVTLGRLVQHAMRMRPSRIVVGEVQPWNAAEILHAIGRGVPGLCTMQAESAQQALLKLAAMPATGLLSASQAYLVRAVAAQIDVVVQLDLGPDGRHRVREILAVPGQIDGMVIAASALFYAEDGRLVRGDGRPPHPERFARRGIDLDGLLAEPERSAQPEPRPAPEGDDPGDDAGPIRSER